MAPRGRFQARSSDGKTPKGAPFLPAPRLRTLRQSIRAARTRPDRPTRKSRCIKQKRSRRLRFCLSKKSYAQNPAQNGFARLSGKTARGAGIPPPTFAADERTSPKGRGRGILPTAGDHGALRFTAFAHPAICPHVFRQPKTEPSAPFFFSQAGYFSQAG